MLNRENEEKAKLHTQKHRTSVTTPSLKSPVILLPKYNF